MNPIRVLLVDDHRLVRAGLRALLAHLPGVEVVAEASTGREVRRLVQTHQPSLVLMDVAMPGQSGLDVAAQLAATHPAVRVLMLSMHANEEYVLRALQVGAAGYLLKDASWGELHDAISTVAAGHTYLGRGISAQVLDDYLRRVTTAPKLSLTPRQRQILKLLVDGRSNKEMAATLGVSLKTIEAHRAHLRRRLRIDDVAGLVRYAIRSGIVIPE